MPMISSKSNRWLRNGKCLRSMSYWSLCRPILTAKCRRRIYRQTRHEWWGKLVEYQVCSSGRTGRAQQTKEGSIGMWLNKTLHFLWTIMCHLNIYKWNQRWKIKRKSQTSLLSIIPISFKVKGCKQRRQVRHVAKTFSQQRQQKW